MSRKVIVANPRSSAEIEDIAVKVIRTFQPSALKDAEPFDIERFFELKLPEIAGVSTDYRRLPLGVHGFTDSDRKESVISSDLIDDPAQEFFCRSTMAHETGHAVIHVPEFKLKKSLLKSIHDTEYISLKMYRESDIPCYKNPEWQAWRFASALLMPMHIFKDIVNSGYDIGEISKIFKVNPAFVKTRIRTLKIKTF